MGCTANRVSDHRLGRCFSAGGCLAAQRLLYPKVAFRRSRDSIRWSQCGAGVGLSVDPRVHGSMVKRVPARISGGRSAGTGRKIGQPICWPVCCCRLRCKGSRIFFPCPKNCRWTVFSAPHSEAWALSLFGMTFAPLLEELFFRGFLYPVLVRRFGIASRSSLTTAQFWSDSRSATGTRLGSGAGDIPGRTWR